MQFKYQDLGEGIIKLLKQRKQNGENIMVIRATEVKRLLDVQKICGPCRNGRCYLCSNLVAHSRS